MRLIRVEVEHFACIRRAAVDFGPGLNVLYGRNDLGKSTLARAIRAALLIQPSSSFANDYIEWDSDENPSVKVTLELPDGRIWRVEKRFGSSGGSSVLRESTDGETFSPFKKAREVDDEIRTRLGWGIASPATKGAPRGLPTSFLATVLLGEQTDVAGVLRQTLEADSDESGRVRLTSALAAFAQDPLFKRILEEAQGKVDLAFTAKGGRKGGKTSPFREVTDDVKRVKELVEQLARRVDESESARLELEACNEELVGRREARDKAVERLHELRESRSRGEARKKVGDELREANKTFEENQAEIAALTERESKLGETAALLEKAETGLKALQAELIDLRDKEKAAEEALRRIKSDEAEQARELHQKELEKKVLELESASRTLASEREAATKARALHAALTKSERRSSELREAHEQNKETRRAAEASKLAAAGELDLLEVAALTLQKRQTHASIEGLEKERNEALADRAKAKEHWTRAQEIMAGMPSRLPVPDELESAQELARELQMAEAKLGGGLAVVVDRLQPVAIEGSADGSELELSSEASVSFDASRGFALRVGDVAKISVTAGEREARENEAALRQRWESEVVPLLERLNAPDLEILVARAGEASKSKAKADEEASAAAGLEQRAVVREEQLSRLDVLREELAAVEQKIYGEKADAAEALIKRLGSTPLETRRAELRREQAAAESALVEAENIVRTAETERQVLSERIEASQKSLEELGVAEPESGWDTYERQLADRAEVILSKEQGIADELKELAAEQDAEAGNAESQLAELRGRVTGVESKLAESREDLELFRRQANRLEGEIETRRETVAKIDAEASSESVKKIVARLAKMPEPAHSVTDEEMRDAEQRIEEAKREQERARDEVRKAEGALQTVGGQVVIEEQDAAKDALRQAEQKERDVELEYDAWRLLVEKLREAENTEGQHIGEALSQPVTQRFAELTAGRYGKLEVAPNLLAEGLRVSGVRRGIDALSVGTQEQLATLLRLTVAEQLGCTLVLDDHLTQTDPARSAWFRDLLRKHAAKAQVVVLTCRPLDYLFEEDLPATGDVTAARAAGIVRAIDMSRAIVRSERSSTRGAHDALQQG